MGLDVPWTPTNSMISARGNHTATLLLNGQVLIAGGSDGNGALAVSELYNSVNGVWAATNPMNTARIDHTATLMTNGKVLVAGGSGGGLSSAEIYDPLLGTWTQTGAMNDARGYHTATLLANGKILIAGGYTAGNIKKSRSTSELYDPQTGIWTATGSMNYARSAHSATLLPNGKVLVAGGSSNGSVTQTSEIYDPNTGTWEYTNAMFASRYHHAATVLPNGNVLICGGQNMDFIASAEIYDPISGMWTPTGAMSVGRSYHTATLMTDGMVLVSGASISGFINAELFDPAKGIWTRTSAMNASRAYCTTTILPNGKVLVAGNYFNYYGTISVLASAELFNDTMVITLANAVNGVITGNVGPYPANTEATLHATPNPGYLFGHWTGDASGTANPLSLLMNFDKAIGATFEPDTNDDDNDGLTNYQEIVEYGTDPTKPDTDGDGAKDSVDAFPRNPTEWLDTDHDGIGDNADPDDDGDGLSDVAEINIYHTDPKRADSDGDGISDPDELQVYHTNPMDADTDHDGLNDSAELAHGTNPNVADTDGDGFLDGYEVLTGKSPLDPLDHPALVAEARTAIEFTFPSALGKTYRIEDSIDLVSWTAVESGIAGNGAVIQRFYSTRNMPKRYFRVEEDAP